MPLITRCFMVIAVVAIAACDESKRVRVGMTEREVVEVLGRPTVVVTDRHWFNDYIWLPRDEQSCLPRIQKVLFFGRLLNKDVAVGFASDGRVVCAEGTYNTAVH